jgi:hypothetical protein
VPKELANYLQQHKDTLIPEFRKVWEEGGFRTSGTWEEVFGQNRATDEIFMAWHFARYAGRVVEAGKTEYALPMYVNAALGRTSSIADAVGKRHEAGTTETNFAIGGPMDDLMDVWRAGGPRIDILGPDIYSPDFAAWCARYTRSGNPLFIPETGALDSAARALYAFGHHDAIGFSLFGIEKRVGKDPEFANIDYDLLSRLAPLILEHQGNGTMSAVLLGPNDPPQKVKLGNYTLEAAFLRPRRVLPTEARMPGAPPPRDPPPTAAAIFIATGPDEYFAAGNGVKVTFSPNTPGPPLAGLATVENGTFVNGRWVPDRLLAGDDTREGEYLDLQNMDIQRVTLYRYR